MTEREPQPLRKTWFVTRPQRDPQFHPEALKALDIATKHFTLHWEGNRQIQAEYERVLIEKGLKQDHISKDASGGRTWAAMLRTFSYIYLDADGYLKPTKAGAEILAGKNERENIVKQLLTLQIPNAYFLDSGFRPKYDEGFKIFPVRFLLRLANQPLLRRTITKDEIALYAMSAKRDEDLEYITNQIVISRTQTVLNKEEAAAEIKNTFEHRARSDSDARTYLENNRDVANTFMLLCEFTGLVEYQRNGNPPCLSVPDELVPVLEKTLAEYDRKYTFREASRYSSLDLLAQANGLSFNSFKVVHNPNVKQATNMSKKIVKAKTILASYPNASDLTYDEIVKILTPYFHLEESCKLALSLDDIQLTSIDDEFATRYLHEASDRQFEDDTGKILSALGFEVIMRPRPVKDSRTNIEILAKYCSNEYCIFDAKNYAENFALSSNLRSIMQSEYIPNYDNFDGGTLTHFGYVTANKFSGDKMLKDITEKAKAVIPNREITGIIISANALLGYLDYCRINDVTMKERKCNLVAAIQNKGYAGYQELIPHA